MKRLSIFIIFLSLFLSLINISIYAQSANLISLDVQLTGSPAPWSFIQQVLEKRIKETLSLGPGDEISVDYGKANKFNLNPNQFKKVNLNVKFNKNGLPRTTTLVRGEPQQIQVRAAVYNLDTPRLKPVFLMFSDHPEKVSERGVLFSGACIKNSPVRFQFYHTGEKLKPAHFLVLRFYNQSDKEKAVLHVLGSSVGPDSNVMKIGHLNNLKFLERYVNFSGEIIEIKPESFYDLMVQRLPPDELSCGTFEFCLLEGKPVSFYLVSKEKIDEDLSFPIITSATDVHARGVYMLADFYMKFRFNTVEKENYISLGDVSLRNIFPQKKLKGGYGTIYEIDVFLKNSSPVSKIVKLFFQPRGGVATGTFLIDKKLIQIGFAKAYQSKILTSIKLKKGEEKLVHISTLPEGGSYYPVRLVFRTEDGNNSKLKSQNAKPQLKTQK